MDHEDRQKDFYARRTHKSLYAGPQVGSRGYYPVVQKITTTEIPFEDTKSALRFLRSTVRKEKNARVIINQKKLGFVSRGD